MNLPRKLGGRHSRALVSKLCARTSALYRHSTYSVFYPPHLPRFAPTNNKVDKLEFIQHVLRVSSEEGRNAELALYRKCPDEAEAILLQASPPLVYRAIKLNVSEVSGARPTTGGLSLSGLSLWSVHCTCLSRGLPRPTFIGLYSTYFTLPTLGGLKY